MSAKFVLEPDEENDFRNPEEPRKSFKRLITLTAKSEQKTSNMSLAIICQNQLTNLQDEALSKTQPKQDNRKRSFPDETPNRPLLKPAKRLIL